MGMKKTKEQSSNVQNGQDQITQILKEFEMGCDEAIIRREGKRLILEPKKRQKPSLKKLAHVTNDFPHVDITLFGDFRL